MSKNNSKQKFLQTWSNQTNLGKKFGLSEIAVGKLLIEAGLNDPTTKEATQKALDEGYAKSTPLKDGTPYFMWNIEKVRPLISKDHKPLSKVDYWVNEVVENIKIAKQHYEEAEANVLVGYAIEEYASVFDDVPNDIVGAVKGRIRQMGIYEFDDEEIE